MKAREIRELERVREYVCESDSVWGRRAGLCLHLDDRDVFALMKTDKCDITLSKDH